MKIGRVQKHYQNLGRSRQIIRVFVKHGFAQIFEQMNLAVRVKLRSRIKRISKPSPPLTTASRLRAALEELGPTFIKIGQVLSTRSFVLPPDFIQELSKLQDRVQPVPFEHIQITIESEFGQPLETLFAEFSILPLASASIAQVHRARLHSGEDVIVKVRRPGISKIIRMDFNILLDLAKLLDRHIDESRQYDPVNLVGELRRSMLRELDFENEARNIEHFRENFRNVSFVRVPQVFGKYTCEKILTLEFIDGIKISDIEELKACAIDLQKIAHFGTQFILKQIFEDGFFHADPHPGNIFVTKDGKIAPVDFGIMGRLDQALMHEMADVLIAVGRRDIDLLLRVMINLGALEIDADLQNLRFDLAEFLNSYYGLSLNNLNMKKIIDEGIDIISRHQVKIPSNLLLLFKTLGTYEDLGRRLDPEYNFIQEVKPYLQLVMMRRMDPRKILYESGKSLRDFYDLLKVMPREIELIMRRMRRGRMAIELQHRGLEKLITEMDRSFNRLSFSLIIASLMVASSLIMVFNKGPMIFGFPVLGALGYLFAGFLGIGLLFAILRSGKL